MRPFITTHRFDALLANSAPRIAVLTGGPGCGKTTLLEALAREQIVTIPEAAVQLINELNEKLSVEEQRTWRNSHFMEFQEMLIDRQLDLEAQANLPGWRIADRGLLDILGFCRFRGAVPPQKLTQHLLENRYSHAFLLEPLPDFPDRRNTGRISSRQDALEIGECLRTAYSDAGVPVVSVPFMTVGERADFVLNCLAQLQR